MYGIINAKIYTVEGDDWSAKPVTAMAIDGDRIAKVGSDEEVKAFVGDGKLYDMEGKVILPGFVDGHVHIPGTAFNELFECDFHGVYTKEDSIALLKDFVEAHPDMDEYYGAGYNMGACGEHPDERVRDWFDGVCADKPIYVRSYDCHNWCLNSKAMEVLGIDRNTTTSGSGLIHRDKDGEPTGVFADVRDVGIKEPTYNDAQQLAALKHFNEKMNKWGYTSVMSIAPGMSISFNKWAELEETGGLTLRANLSGLILQESYEENEKALDRLRETVHSDKLRVTTAKYLLDGVMEGKSACLKTFYRPEAGLGDSYNAPPEWDAEDLKESFRRNVEKGYQLHVHAIGDGAAAITLDGFESVDDLYADLYKEGSGPRNVMTHLELVDEPDRDRMAKMKVIAAIQTFWHLYEPDFTDAVEIPIIGRERVMTELYPAKSLVDRGIKITCSGDYPVSHVNDPFAGIRAGVTRNYFSEAVYGFDISDEDDPIGLLNPSERLSVQDMIEGYTINGAYQLFREDEIGSIREGKYADFIVVSGDPFTVPHVRLDGIKVLATVFDGKTVFGQL